MAVRRLLLAGLLLVLGVLAGWRIVSLAMADRLAATDPDAALARVPGHPGALVARARKRLGAGEIAMAQADARSALAGDPLNGEAFSLIARAAQARAGSAQAGSGHAESAQAARLSVIAVRRNPRDVGTRAWLAQRALQQHAYAAALAQLEAILRLSPRQTPVLLPRIAALAVDPRFARALGPVLATQPRWRDPLVVRLVAEAAHDDTALATLDAGHVLTDAEFSAWLQALVEGGRVGEAYARWVGRQIEAGQADARPVDARPVDAAPTMSALANPAFRSAAFGTTFGWQRLEHTGASFIAQGRGREAVAWQVHVEPPATVYLWQRLLLPAGRYRIGVDMRVEPEFPGDPRAVAPRWSLACAAGDRGLAAAAPAADGAWHRVGLEVSVPADCPLQILRLQSAPDATNPTRAMRVSLGHAQLVRQPEPEPEPEPRPRTPVARVGAASGAVLVEQGIAWGRLRGPAPQMLQAEDRLLIAPGGSAVITVIPGCRGVLDRVGTYAAQDLCAALAVAARDRDAATSAATQTLHDGVVAARDLRAPVPTGR